MGGWRLKESEERSSRSVGCLNATVDRVEDRATADPFGRAAHRLSRPIARPPFGGMHPSRHFLGIQARAWPRLRPTSL